MKAVLLMLLLWAATAAVAVPHRATRRLLRELEQLSYDEELFGRPPPVDPRPGDVRCARPRDGSNVHESSHRAWPAPRGRAQCRRRMCQAAANAEPHARRTDG